MDNESFLNQLQFIHKIIKDYSAVDNRKSVRSNFLVHILQGSARFYSDTTDFKASAGDLIFIPSSISYQTKWFANPSTSYAEYKLYVFKYFPDKNDYIYPMQKIMPSKTELALLSELDTFKETTCYSFAIFYQLMSLLLQKFTFNDNSSHQSKVVKTAITYMERNPSCKVSEISKALGISESSLYSFFKKATGNTPTEIRHKIIAEAARSLLITTDLTSDQISNKLGLSSSYHLRMILKKQFGKAVKEIRKEHINF